MARPEPRGNTPRGPPRTCRRFALSPADLGVEAAEGREGAAPCNRGGRRWLVVTRHAVPPRHSDDLVVFGGKPRGEMPTYKTRSPGDGDLHRLLRFFARKAICVGHTALRKSPTVLASVSAWRQ